MGYFDFEKSSYAGKPVELIRFSYGDQLWLYTTSSQEVFFNEDAYIPTYIERGQITRGGDTSKDTCELKVALTDPVSQMFRSGWLDFPMIVTVYRHHLPDLDFAVIWKGRITSRKCSGSVATLQSNTSFTLLRRAGLRRVYQVSCPHPLYSPQCGVNQEGFRVDTSILSISGSLLSISGISGYPENYFKGGKISFGESLRMVISSSGSGIVMLDSFDTAYDGASVSLYPGCSRDMDNCLNRFNNLDNFGGFPFLPNKNPFTGDALV